MAGRSAIIGRCPTAAKWAPGGGSSRLEGSQRNPENGLDGGRDHQLPAEGLVVGMGEDREDSAPAQETGRASRRVGYESLPEGLLMTLSGPLTGSEMAVCTDGTRRRTQRAERRGEPGVRLGQLVAGPAGHRRVGAAYVPLGDSMARV